MITGLFFLISFQDDIDPLDQAGFRKLVCLLGKCGYA